MSKTDKWNANNRFIKQADFVPYPAGVVAGVGLLPGADRSNKRFWKTSVLENSTNTERFAKGDEFVWRPVLEGIEYLIILLLPILFMIFYSDGAGRKSG